MTLFRLTVGFTVFAVLLVLAGLYMRLVTFASWGWMLPSIPVVFTAAKGWLMIYDAHKLKKALEKSWP